MPAGSSVDSAESASNDARSAQTSFAERPQGTSRRHAGTRIVGLVVLALPATGAAVAAEAAFIGYIFLLVGTLGFPAGLATFVVTEAAIGVVVLAFIELTWPRLKPAIQSAMDKPPLNWLRLHHVRTISSGGVIVATVIAAIVAALLLDLPAVEDVVSGVAVFAIIVSLLAGSRWMSEKLRRLAKARSVAQRSLAIAVLMVVIGPFGGVLYRALVTRLDYAFALTIASAALFGMFWVPFYYYGVFSLVS